MFYSIEVCRCGWPTGGVVIIKKVQIKDRELLNLMNGRNIHCGRYERLNVGNGLAKKVW